MDNIVNINKNRKVQIIIYFPEDYSLAFDPQDMGIYTERDLLDYVAERAISPTVSIVGISGGTVYEIPAELASNCLIGYSLVQE